MIINDLNYFEDASEEVFGGRGFKSNTNINTTAVLDKKITETINKNVKVTLNLPGQIAEATAVADVYGFNKAIASTYTVTQVDKVGNVTGSFSESLSAGY
jgi:hypothetical protein